MAFAQRAWEEETGKMGVVKMDDCLFENEMGWNWIGGRNTLWTLQKIQGIVSAELDDRTLTGSAMSAGARAAHLR